MEENRPDQKIGSDEPKTESGKGVGAVGQILGVILFLALLAALGYCVLTFIQMLSEAWAVTMSGMTTGTDGYFIPHH